MPDEDLLLAFLAIVDRHRLTDGEAAALSGLSVPTVRIMRRGRLLPVQERPRLRAERFVATNRGAMSRGELRLSETGPLFTGGAVAAGALSRMKHGKVRAADGRGGST